MNNTKLALALVRDLRNLASSLEAFLLHNEAAKEAAAEEPQKYRQKQSEPVTLDMVRAAMIEKSQSGKQAEVKALITEYGANKLTEVDPACYKNLLKEVEEI